MAIFKTTSEILTSVWDNKCEEITDPSDFPKRVTYQGNYNSLKLEDIETWEEIYFEEGNIGVYAAWSPYVEFYIITYNLFLDTRYGIKVFKGPSASESVIQELKKYNIQLPTNRIWVDTLEPFTDTLE